MQSLIVFPSPAFDETYMPLRNEDKTWVVAQITEAVKELQPHGWRRLVHTLRELGPIIGSLSFVLGVIAAAITLGIFAFSGRTEEASFRGRTEERLKNIEAGLGEIKGQFIKQNLATHAGLPLTNFTKTLPDLGSSITAAQAQHLKVSSTVMTDLSSKLAATDKTTPAFWPVAAAVISYRSSLLTGGTVEAWQVFPLCKEPVDMDASPNAAAQLVGKDGKPPGPKIPISRIGVQDCYVELDGKKASGWDCKHCLVRYSGGPVSLRDVHFEDCLFVLSFPSQQPPSPSGQRLGEILLTSNLTKVEIKAL